MHTNETEICAMAGCISLGKVTDMYLVAKHCWYNRESDWLLASAVGSLALSILYLNCQRTFKKPWCFSERASWIDYIL